MLTYAVIAVAAILVIALVATENPGKAGATLIIAGSLLVYLVGIELVPLLQQNFWTIVGLLALYLITGTIWGLIKWVFFVKRVRRWVNKQRPMEAERLRDLAGTEFLNYGHSMSLPPIAGEFKVRILTWMGYWPLSILVTLANNPFRIAFTWIYDKVTNSFTRISARIYGD